MTRSKFKPQSQRQIAAMQINGALRDLGGAIAGATRAARTLERYGVDASWILQAVTILTRADRLLRSVGGKAERVAAGRAVADSISSNARCPSDSNGSS